MTNFAHLSTAIVILNERKYRKAREFVKIAPGARDDHDPPSRERKRVTILAGSGFHARWARTVEPPLTAASPQRPPLYIGHFFLSRRKVH